MIKTLKNNKKAVIIFVLSLFISIFGFFGVGLAENQPNTCLLIDDGKEIVLSCESKDAFAVLEDNFITINPKDKVDLSRFDDEKIIEINRFKTVYLINEDDVTPYGVYSYKTNDLIEEIKLDTDKQKLLIDEDTVIEDGLTINVADIIEINIMIDGQNNNVLSYRGETIKEVIKSLNCSVEENDYINVDINSQISEPITIIINKAITKTITEEEETDYETEIRYNKSLSAGSKNIVQEGEKGKTSIEKEIVQYYDGTIVSETILSETVVSEPKNQIIEIGTKLNSNDTEYNGLKVGQVINGRKTHYCACGVCGTGTGNTASGAKVYNGMPNPYYIACNWLPLGAVVDIDGVVYTVADRGGSGLSSIGRVDIFTPEGHSACYKKGTGSCTITILSF